MEHWICPREYVDLAPVNNYFKQFEAKKDAGSAIVNLHTLFRKVFFLQRVENTVITITADDYYMLYINGSFVSQGPANAYHFVYPLNKLDITPFLKPGINVIAVDTLYNGYINRAYNSGDNRMGLYAQVTMNGTELTVTDESWKYTFDHSFLKTTVTHGYDTQSAEYRDMRKYPHGWMQAQYDDSRWAPAAVKKEDDHICIEQITPNVATQIIQAQKVEYLAPNHFVLDFGKEVVGQMIIDLQGKKGNRILTRFGEEMNPDGSVRHKMRCNIDYEEYMILSGEMDHIQNYEYKAFRYLEILSQEKALTPDMVRVAQRNYPVLEKMIFNSNVKLLEDIWAICENAAIISSQEAYLDCPSREKGQYLGDLMITGQTHSYITGDTRLYKKALIDFANSSFIDKGLMAVVPGNYMQEIADFSLLYPQILWNYYQMTGDTDLLKTLLPVAEDVVDRFRLYEREDGLLACVNGKWNLVDWPKNLRDDYDFALTEPIGAGCHNVINAYYCGAQKTVNTLRNTLGLGIKYDVQKLILAYEQAFYRPEQGLYADSDVSQHCSFHSNVLPMYFELCSNKVSCRIADLIMEKGLCCGVFFAYFALKALAKWGFYEKEYQLLTNSSSHSWKNMLDEGATCTFEAWGKDQKRNTSLCHPWGSAPVILILEDLLGFRMEKGQWTKGEPHLPEGVSASARGGLLSIDKAHNPVTAPGSCQA